MLAQKRLQQIRPQEPSLNGCFDKPCGQRVASLGSPHLEVALPGLVRNDWRNELLGMGLHAPEDGEERSGNESIHGWPVHSISIN